jgi:hypothetical protein
MKNGCPIALDTMLCVLESLKNGEESKGKILQNTSYPPGVQPALLTTPHTSPAITLI